MNRNLTNFDVKIIILLIILMLLKSIYNLYIFISPNEYPIFNLVSFLTAITYLFASIYFFFFGAFVFSKCLNISDFSS